MTGPTISVAIWADEKKYRQEGETFNQKCARVAGALTDNEEHYNYFNEQLKEQRFLPGGRVQSASGSYRKVTAFNCFVMQKVPDSLMGIMAVATEAAKTMQMGGGVGYDFSGIRPKGAKIKSLGSQASGPVSFMQIMDAICKTIASAGHRRGAQMGCLRVDHPDIMEFITAKANSTNLTQFNVSVLVTDKFMQAVKDDQMFDLVFEDQVYDTIRAVNLWEAILRNTWDWAEPGVIFIDRVNHMNNLYYCEDISATNPCLHPDSLIETVEGRVKIKDIKEPVKVYTMLPDGSLGIRQASASWVSKPSAKTLIVTVGSGKQVICTPDHKIYVDGKGWVEAQDLRVGDQLVHLCRSRRGVAYSGVKLTTEDNRAYRMVAEATYGEIPEGHDVHHIDGDTYNNSYENLEIICHGEHASLTRYNCANDHMVNGYNEKGLWRFVSSGSKVGKTVKPMPSEIKSNLKNQKSACVISVEEGPVTEVYDLSVEDTHNFISDFIVVHNCGEQPLPPYGACLLGSWNMTKYVYKDDNGKFQFNEVLLKADIPHTVRAMDNVIDETIYPLPEQEQEAKNKRRMGLGITGLGNVLGALGIEYGSLEAQAFTKRVLKIIANGSYYASAMLAKEKGAFPLYDEKRYLAGKFIKKLDKEVRDAIKEYGIRNSHLTSIAPTGTISLTANNVSSGLEPVFSYSYTRTIQTADGPMYEQVEDYAYREWGVKCKTADQVPVKDHVAMLTAAQEWVDSACSKTCNVGNDVTWSEFKDVYMQAYDGGAKGCTTFRVAGKRFGILNASAVEDVVDEKVEEDETIVEGGACYVDPTTGFRTCDTV
jgi:ribonucleoside-diphosphate reductase alpha chain